MRLPGPSFPRSTARSSLLSRVVLLAALALAVAPAGLAKRAPTYLERVTVVAAFNIPGWSGSPRFSAAALLGGAPL